MRRKEGGDAAAAAAARVCACLRPSRKKGTGRACPKVVGPRSKMVGLLLSRVGTGRVLILASEKLRLGSVLLKSSPCLSVLRLPEQIDQGRCASAMGRVSQWTQRQLRTGRNGDDGKNGVGQRRDPLFLGR